MVVVLLIIIGQSINHQPDPTRTSKSNKTQARDPEALDMTGLMLACEVCKRLMRLRKRERGVCLGLCVLVIDPPTHTHIKILQAGHVATARLLLARGAPIAAVDGNGSSALLLACLEGQLEAAELLLEEAKVCG